MAPPTVYVDPPSHHFLNDRLFDAQAARLGGDNLMAPYVELRRALAARGVAAHTVDQFAPGEGRALVLSFGGRHWYRTARRLPNVVLSAFFAMECPIVEPKLYRALPDVARAFRRVLTWTDAATLAPFTRAQLSVEQFRWPQSRDRVVEDLWRREGREFLVMINANKLPRLYDRELYTARLRAVEFFHRFGEIHLYGPNWDRMPNRVGETWVPATARRLHGRLWRWKQRRWPDPLYAAAAGASRGPTPAKLETLSRHTFAICFENMALKGWITEKLFDCLFAGTVPVYWGAPDIADWVPADCFVDMRDFASFAALRDHLRSLGPAEVGRLRDAGRDFVASPRFDPFRIATFVERIVRMVGEDA